LEYKELAVARYNECSSLLLFYMTVLQSVLRNKRLYHITYFPAAFSVQNLPTFRCRMAQSTASTQNDAWKDAWQDTSAAQKYARGELATRHFADILVHKSGLAKAENDIYALDIAAGTGAVEAAIYEALPKEKWGGTRVLATDISEPMLQWVKARGEKEGWTGLETQIVDGRVSLVPTNN